MTSVLSLGESECLMKLIQMIFSQKTKIFSKFFSQFHGSTSKFEHFEKKSLIADLFPDLLSANILVT